ncbi:hypothetical protein M405DRAFT_937981 [Rhizopogon salebrosus TDB-379]|nr:hypothetical protein M405DRAFT_937981 [Rhizopogon salebrosus TDB-379]
MLDALHLALVLHSVYYYLVTNYANFDALTEVVWSGKLQIAVSIFVVWLAHSLYAYRIWIGICSPINRFAMAYVVNIVSTGRSRALPIVVGIVVIISSGVAISESSIVLFLLTLRFNPMISPHLGICRLFTDLIGIEWATLGEFKVGFRSRFGRDLDVDLDFDLELQNRPNPISTLTPHDFDLISTDFASRFRL